MEGLVLALSETSTTSLVAGAAALLGALVGGGITGWVTLKAEDRRHEHGLELERARDTLEQQREERVVIGTARELRTSLRSAVGTVAAALDQGCWWPQDLAPTAPSSADRTAVLAKLTADEWQSLDRALLHLGHVLYLRSLATTDAIPRLDASSRETLEAASTTIREGLAALDRLCRLEPSGSGQPEREA